MWWWWGGLTKTKVKLWKNANSPFAMGGGGGEFRGGGDDKEAGG